MPDPVPGFQQRERPADHDGRVLFRCHQDVGTHRSSGCFAVRAGDAKSIVIVPGNRAPGLGAFKNRNVLCSGCHDLRIVIMHGSRPHNELHIIRYILFTMPDNNRNAQFPQIAYILALHRVRSGNIQPHVKKDFRQRRHGNTADSDQVSSPPGRHIIFKLCHLILRNQFFYNLFLDEYAVK